ncbi:MAG: glycosyltransferase family 39 protein [Candidatus Omnitrophica bacterium]|nr:glycosyltransferase family 39 protein [Candidatus Omnitrophota bacterium]
MRNFVIPIGIFVISLAIFTFRSDVIGLEFKGDENFYFQSSRQMVEEGDWITPYYFKKPRFEKPVLYYWIVASLFKFFDMNWKIARLPAAASMALVVIITYLFGLRFFNRGVGILSSLVLITSIAVFRYSRLVLPEAFFVLAISLSVYLMVKKDYTFSYVVMGLAMLTKGPIGLILPIFIMAGYRYGMGEKGFFKEARLLRGVFIALLISLPWFILMIKTHGRPYIDHIFFRETIQRIGSLGTTTRLSIKTMLNYLKALGYFIPVVFIFYLPWSLLFIPSIREASRRITKKDPSLNGAVFSLVWFFAILIFFTFLGEKHRHYMLAVAVPFGLMTGNYLYNAVLFKKRFKGVFIFAVLLVFFFGFESIKLAISEEVGGLGAMFNKMSYTIADGDNVGIGSHSIIPQQVEVYVNHPVGMNCYKWPSREESDIATMRNLNRVFLKKNNSFLIIKARDFDKYITPHTKKRLTFLGRGYIYNKEIDAYGILDAIRRMDREAFLDLFREKVYFVTTKSNEHMTYGAP